MLLSRNTGFTLLELLIAIAILAIISFIGFSFNSDTLKHNRAEMFLRELKTNVAFARTKATASDEIVILCPAPTNQAQQRASFDCSSSWNNSRIAIFVDRDNNGRFDEDEDTLHRLMEPLKSGDNLAFSGQNRLRFDSGGLLSQSRPGEFIFCPANANSQNQQLTISQAGTAIFRGATTNTCR
ncbi:GspH/FimT family protein [Pseudoalteromonas sp. T1lg65]|uniref:GspH/FimT family protein n=1 Tax=Pseudoalteromonas sp. T1lg65 TaxID=2077101 RepID=UPI003F7B29B2